MPDAASPLDALPASALNVPGLGVTVEPVTARVSLRLRDEAAIGRVTQALGLALPREACRSSEAEGASALWLGPDEWLLLSTRNDGSALAAWLTDAIASAPASVVDVTHRSLTLRVEGARAADALLSGCPLDLGLRAFPVGAATRTVFGKTEIVLCRVGPESFLLDVWRSFAPYALGLLREEARSLAA